MSNNQQETNPEGVVGLMLRLRGFGITDTRLMKALEAIPHEQFIPVEHYEKAYRPRSMPIACGQTMVSPDTTARMITALNPQPSHTVLEIGTGSGYQSALLSMLAKKVHTIDRYKTLLSSAQDRHQRLNISNVTYAQTDGGASTEQGLYDCIICDLAFEEMPRGLLDQLVSGGLVVTAIGPKGGEQSLVRLTKIGSRFEREDLFSVRFGSFESGIAEAL
ncbi:MAG: protein-L-isoaspartate(D-aspartate) O-methyltransferase [Rhizobiaceae bacterium]